MRILYQHGSREVGAVAVLHAHALALVALKVAESHLDVEQGGVGAPDLAALVDKADQRLGEKFAGEDHVGGHARFVLFGDGKVKDAQALVLVAGGVGDGPAQHLKAVARQQRRPAVRDILPQGVGVAVQVSQRHTLVSFGAGADIDKIIVRKIDVVAEAAAIDRDALAALFEDAAHGGDVGVVAVEIHQVMVKMQNFHLSPPSPSPKTCPCRRSR